MNGPAGDVLRTLSQVINDHWQCPGSPWAPSCPACTDTDCPRLDVAREHYEQLLAVDQIKRRLQLTARWIVEDHWPSPEDKLCRICRTPDCQALVAAAAYLDLIGDPYVPAAARPMQPLPGTAFAIAVRSAGDGRSAAELRAVADRADIELP